MGGLNDLSPLVPSSLLVSLRVSPIFLFAPPFTLTRIPKLFVWLLGLGISMTLVSTLSQGARISDMRTAALLAAALHELCLGMIPVLALLIMFGALQMVGRTIDIQSGFGLALLIDPTTRTQTPLVGMIFAYVAGAVFFAMDGHHEVLKFFAASFELVPIGGVRTGVSLTALSSYLFTTFALAFGVGALTILILFLADISVAMLSRTVPQMNALLLGVQVKALLLILTLPIAIAIAGTICVRLVTSAFYFMAKAL